MQQLVNTKKILLGLSFALISLFSCRQGRQVFERKELFSLNIGRMEKELDMSIKPDSTRFIRDNYVYISGHFYIVNSRINKVVELTSYGDILSLYYDPVSNPMPVTLSLDEKEGAISNLNGYAHSFENLGLITVDSEKNIWVEDQVSSGREEIDGKSGILLDQVIRRFSADGKEIDFIGQEGVSGTPFPFIQGLHCSKSDQLTVVTRTLLQWEIFRFSPAGQLIQRVSFSNEQLPGTASHINADLEDIVPDYQNNNLYLKINYIEKRFGKSDGALGVEYFKKSSIWVFDIEADQFQLHFDLPKKWVKDPMLENAREVIYDLVGIDRRGNLFFQAIDERNFLEVLIVRPNGQVIDRIVIKISDKDLYFQQLFLSPEGILSGMFSYEDQVKFYWWRTDYLVRRVKN